MAFVKKIVKNIFPAAFLKAVFLIYNIAKIRTIDRILFPELIVAKSDFFIYRTGHPFRELNVTLDELPKGAVKDYMQKWNDWMQEEFILMYDQPCWIEPDYGWALTRKFRLIYYSLGVSRTWFQQKPHFFKFLVKRKIKQVDKVISLRDSGEENYFHFYNDVISKLHFLQLHKFDLSDAFILISKRLWVKPYFQYYLENSAFLQSLQFHVQEDEYIHCSTAIFCKPLTHRKDLWSAVLSPFSRKLPTTNGSSKVFLTRHKSRLRFIENSDQIEVICRQHGFIVLDTDHLTPREQQEIFSSVKVLVGIHGAGLTNMMFMKDKCSILEIFPPPSLGYLPFHYIMLAKLFNFQYNALIGEMPKSKYSGAFKLNPDLFEKELIRVQ